VLSTDWEARKILRSAILIEAAEFVERIALEKQNPARKVRGA
jgi:hypothetical protein